MHLGAVFFRDQRVGGLLDAVVKESVGVAVADDKSRIDGLRRAALVEDLFRPPMDQRERRDIGGAAEAGEVFQALLGLGSESRPSFSVTRSTTLSL